ncbi:NAD(P)H dehydrogenase (quinone) [Pustulibacterium marinum]|uniref:NAD(P)H dehydrogenase (Quinone) n=1 Tax=Pustulibacterium marinum TaxID=1224947 RepID=A0A1I7I9A7_9FLAO|nr:SDR family oxidoreductase [Pustulibacterium marinum]SFU69565.1 NAD(P)H dehydrogenase (quinone) [Pustulibacterium marinum]
MKYLVTAASGKLGTFVIDYLLKKTNAENIIAMIRDPKKAANLEQKGIEVRIADYTHEKAMEAAFQGVDKVLFISSNANPNTLSDPTFSRIDQHRAVINSLKNANVKFVAYTSLVNAKASKTFLAEDHRNTEKLLEESGLNYTVLRNNWYLENELSLLVNASKGNLFAYSSEEGKVGWALEREYAEAAANVLFIENPQLIYELGGTSSTYAELAKALKKATNTDFDVKKISQVEYKNLLKEAGLAENIAEALASFQNDIQNGVLDLPSNDLEILLERKPSSLFEGLKELIQ